MGATQDLNGLIERIDALDARVNAVQAEWQSFVAAFAVDRDPHACEAKIAFIMERLKAAGINVSRG